MLIPWPYQPSNRPRGEVRFSLAFHLPKRIRNAATVDSACSARAPLPQSAFRLCQTASGASTTVTPQPNTAPTLCAWSERSQLPPQAPEPILFWPLSDWSTTFCSFPSDRPIRLSEASEKVRISADHFRAAIAACVSSGSARLLRPDRAIRETV